MQKIKTILLLLVTNVIIVATLNLLIYLIGIFFDVDLYAQGTVISLSIFALVFGFLGAYINLLMSKRLVKTIYRIRPITAHSQGKEKIVYDTVAYLARKHHITMPEVGIYISQDPNAFATGPNKHKSIIAVSSGLLHNMTEEEIQGVIGHEFAHILNGDMVRMTILQGIMNTFVIFLSRILAYAIDLAMRRDDNRGLGSVAYILVVYVLDIVLGFAAMLVLMSYSRQREFRADFQSAMLVGKQKMVDALKKLKLLTSSKHHKLSQVQDEVSYLKINGGKRWLNILSSHPTLDERIERLQNIKN